MTQTNDYSYMNQNKGTDSKNSRMRAQARDGAAASAIWREIRAWLPSAAPVDESTDE